MKESPREMIDRCEKEEFTGQTIIHWNQGRAMEIESRERWRPTPPDENVDITEIKGERNAEH